MKNTTPTPVKNPTNTTGNPSGIDLQFTKQTLREAWDEYQSASVNEFPARSFELLFQAVRDIVNHLQSLP